MATLSDPEFETALAPFPVPETSVSLDRVLRTAGENARQEPEQSAMLDPAVDHGHPQLAARRADVDAKHQRVVAFLEQHGYDGLVLSRADSFAWFTSGGEVAQMLASEHGSALLYINARSRAVVCDNVQSARIFEEEVGGLGFQLKERPWHEDLTRVVAELGGPKRLAGDLSLPGVTDERTRLAALRFPLSPFERQRLRELGRALSHSLEATCRNFEPEETESDLAGHLAHRLMREGIVPLDIRVASDERLARFRQPTFKAAPIRKYATVAAVGRRHGLCVSATRTVALGRASTEFRQAHSLAAMVDATCIFFSRPEASVGEVFRRARRIYEKYGWPDEWTLDYQGSVIGYHPREALLRPEGTLRFQHGMPVCWSPSVGPARSEDTVVIDGRGYEVVTEAQDWPKLEVVVKGLPVLRPGILER